MAKGRRRTDKRSSRTAGFNCMYRAASFLSVDPYYHSNDYVAPELLPKFLFLLVKNSLINFHWRFFPKGIYEYVIARTKYIDTVCETSTDDGICQIAIIGAGFDSRSVRFTGKRTSIRAFELDTIYTQSEKITQLQKRKISIPGNVVFVPIDFNNESIQERLQESGFDREKRTLFILEGIIMYLTEDAVCSLFTELYGLSAPGSKVVFDYVLASVLRKENRYYGEQNIYRKVETVNEPWTFGLENGEVREFVGRFGFELVENMNVEDLEKRYFTDQKGNLVARINGTHCVAYAFKQF